MQQHTLIAGTEAEKGRNLLRREAVNIAEGDDRPLPLRELSQAILELCTAFSILVSSSGERGHGCGLPSGVQFRGHLSSGPRKRSGSTAGPSPSSGPRDDNGTVRDSRTPRLRPMFPRIASIQVRSEDRPSNLSRP